MHRHKSLKSLRAKGFVEITRPPNGLMMALAVYVGYFVQSGRIPSPLEGAFAAVTAYTLTASSMVVNDIIDREIDAVNNPRRPIPSGLVKASEAAPFSILLGLTGLGSSAVLGSSALVVAAIFYALALSYNAYLKKRGLIGNAAVSATISAPYIYGAVLAEGMVGLPVAIIASMSFLAGMGREVVKGISDVEGDRRRGVQTYAITHGEKAAARLGAFFVFAAVALSPLPVAIGTMSLLYIPPVAIADVGFTYSNIKLLRDPAISKRTKTEYLAWMLMGLVGFLLGAHR
ncbi:Protoheme IX farnesyltransferase [Candidatus Calditenuaceae archaeon HR02]|nr:Protoheme IX farnesyltransferase [Candidatus Calditenuaceae archaeon HR02]